MALGSNLYNIDFMESRTTVLFRFLHVLYLIRLFSDYKKLAMNT